MNRSPSRFGGLRCPSEVLRLKWGDIDWDRRRITVRASKTEHLEGKGIRSMPLSSELQPYLEAVFDQAEPRAEFAITRYRNTNANLRTQFERIIIRSGLEPWEKLFQNLRSTWQTEFIDQRLKLHVVCAWMGNTPKIANRHYLQITESDFEAALATNLHQPLQTDADTSCQGTTGENANRKYSDITTYTQVQAPRAGLEPATLGLEIPCSIQLSYRGIDRGNSPSTANFPTEKHTSTPINCRNYTGSEIDYL